MFTAYLQWWDHHTYVAGVIILGVLLWTVVTVCHTEWKLYLYRRKNKWFSGNKMGKS